MKLEIRNLQSSATYTIDPEGAILGREGSKADIILRDQAVSKKHAKIYEKNGRWYLEDLASSNGTFLDNRRITEPVVLTPGAVFALSENQFEVVQVMNGRSALDMDTGSQDAVDRHPLDDLPPLGMTPGESSVDGEGKRGARSMRSSPSSRTGSPAQMGADPADDMPEPGAQGGVGYFFVAIPKAIAYYLAAIPLIVLNPIGTIRKSIENQRFPAMGPFPLIAYALPAYVVMTGLPVIAGMIGTLLAGSFTFPLIPFVKSVAIGIGAAAVSGFLLHPVGNFIINKLLKGDSNERSRTNYFISILPAMALAQLPAAVLLIVAGLRVPFITVLPAFLTFVVSMIVMFAFYSWMKHFNIVKWAQTVLLVLVILSALGTGWGVVGAVLAGFSTFGSGSPAMAGVPTEGLTAEQKAQLEEAAKQAGGMTPEEAVKRSQELMAKSGVSAEAQEAMKKAMEASAKLGADPALAAKQAEEAVRAAKEAKALQEEAEKNAAAAAKAGKEKPAEAEEEEAEEEKPAEKEEPKPALKSPPAEEDEPEEKPAAAVKTNRSRGPSNEFQEFITQRKEVDEAIEKDPTLLRRKDVLAAYEKYLRKTFEIRAKWKKKKAKDDVEQRINERKKDIEVFEGTAKLVEELHQKIFQ